MAKKLSSDDINAMKYKVGNELIRSIAIAHGLRSVVWNLRSLLGPSGKVFLGGKLVDVNWIVQLSVDDRKILDDVWHDTFGTMPFINTVCEKDSGRIIRRYMTEQAIIMNH